MSTTRYISVVETAKLIRKALKAQFSEIKFSVRSSSYSGGASIQVSWTDGPDQWQVEDITKKFEGAYFDGMIDLKSYKDTILDGEAVHFGADWVFTERTYTPEYLQTTMEIVIKRFGMTQSPEDLVIAYQQGRLWEIDHGVTNADYDFLRREVCATLEHQNRIL